MTTTVFRAYLASMWAASFLCAQGTFTLIDYPGSTGTTVWGINSRKEMAGVYTSADGVSHGFVLSGGRYRPIDYPGAALTIANSINAQGDVVGEYAMTATGPHHG